MHVNYDDLVAHLDQSEDWQKIEAGPDWLIYNGPGDIDGEPIQIVLPPDSSRQDTQALTKMAITILAAIKGITHDTMADRITPSSVKALLDAIKLFDCEPSVFYVNLIAADHKAGYTAAIDFRTSSHPAASSVQTRGDTPEDALAQLLAVLKAKWGRCPHCRRYLDDTDYNSQDPGGGGAAALASRQGHLS